jgi:hypothetical protein
LKSLVRSNGVNAAREDFLTNPAVSGGVNINFAELFFFNLELSLEKVNSLI